MLVFGSPFPKGPCNYIHSTYLGPKRVLVSLLCGACMYYNDTWTVWAKGQYLGVGEVRHKRWLQNALRTKSSINMGS